MDATADAIRESTLADIARRLTHLPAAVVATLSINGGQRAPDVEEGLGGADGGAGEEIPRKDGNTTVEDGSASTETDTERDPNEERATEPEEGETKRDNGADRDPYTAPDLITCPPTLAQQTQAVLSTPPPIQRPLHLLTLPPELHRILLRYVDFADVVRLRRTCKALRSLATPQELAALLGRSTMQITIQGHCRMCLTHDPFRSSLLLSTRWDEGFPLSSQCVKCSMARRDWRIVKRDKVRMGDYRLVWVCRWCGWPVIKDVPVAGGPEPRFHRPCQVAYRRAIFWYFVLGFLQWSLQIGGCALAWRYFRGEKLVFGPTVTAFILLWGDLIVVLSRLGTRSNNAVVLFLEVVVMSCWIPPTYFVAQSVAAAPGQSVERSTVAAFVVFGLNLLFRLVNALGDLAILCGYNRRAHFFPEMPWWRRWLVNPAMAFVIDWTYPQMIEQGVEHAASAERGVGG